MNANVDGKYYEVAQGRSLAMRVLTAARQRMYEDFLDVCRPTPDSSILDVGVSDVVNEGANLLERLYPHPDRITAVGIGDAPDFRKAFPDVDYRRIEPNKALPIPDGAFDIAMSNAVLEHVGSVENQRRFVSELTRVAKKVFIIVPNKFFPVEHHTAIPLLHYYEPLFKRACAILGKEHWASEAELILMSRRRMKLLCPRERCRTGYTGIKLGALSSNIYMYIES